MPPLDPHRLALAAGLATSMLSEAENAEAEALMATNEEFARTVREFRKTLEAESDVAVPERVWDGIKRRLTGLHT